MSDAQTCHVCGQGPLALVPGLAGLPLVSSDCRPTAMRADLYVCQACGTAQKQTDAAWSQAVKEIYESYAIYHQSLGEEQPVFIDSKAAPRSAALLDWISASALLPENGSLADVGCGNGAFLRRFAGSRSGWRLTGLEWDGRHAEAVSSIPGASFCPDGLEGLNGSFDALTMIHVLEHIPGPEKALRRVREHLTSDGLLVLLVPDFTLNPFDLIIADHCTHFSPRSLERLLQASGLEVKALSTGSAVPKEIAALAVLAASTDSVCTPPGPDETGREAASAVSYLARMAGVALAEARRGGIGIFGTSVGGVWLASLLGEKAAFFVDEDPARAGTALMGRPVLTPDQTPPGETVVIPLAPAVAAGIAQRLEIRQREVRWLALASD